MLVPIGKRLWDQAVPVRIREPAPRAGELLLGLRPEHCELVDSSGGIGWQLRVEVVEMLGAERLVYGHLGGTPFTVRLDATLPIPVPGGTMTLAIEAPQLHWFDPTTQQRVT